MYEGYLQHDAQEVLQCILGNIQETCQLLKKEVKNVAELSNKVEEKPNQREAINGVNSTEMDNMEHAEDYKEKLPKGNGKRKSDTEFGNMKKKVKLSTKEHQSLEENQRQTRSKRKATGDTLEIPSKVVTKHIPEHESARPSQKKSKVKISWLKSGTKQPSLLSKFCSLGKISQGPKGQPTENEYDLEEDSGKCENDNTINGCGLESLGNNVKSINGNEVKPINKGQYNLFLDIDR